MKVGVASDLAGFRMKESMRAQADADLAPLELAALNGTLKDEQFCFICGEAGTVLYCCCTLDFPAGRGAWASKGRSPSTDSSLGTVDHGDAYHPRSTF